MITIHNYDETTELLKDIQSANMSALKEAMKRAGIKIRCSIASTRRCRAILDREKISREC